VLDVSSVDSNIPVRKIGYLGNANIDAGDRIRAYLVKSREIEGKSIGQIYGGKECHEVWYVERDFKEEEEADKVEKLGQDGKVLHTYK